ncbi:hypothetical protein [Oceanithermus profundus]|uniref:CvpA family protein n=1 Tax=Oceanithermus profundus (strain DSM 14977 / NBRC 100410 / VKM B-2274 / 506) TaxID=670487 RepID=E4U4T0_OCEP5|nr:hypothetical protein [Oceanithermus profundus]ADR37147.1 hypothetical protein Ocepr_1694 [Oceanithermus profundus DSM 14977]
MLSWLDVLAITTAALATAMGVRRGGGFLLALPIAAALYWLGLDYVPGPSWLLLLGLGSGLAAAFVSGLLPVSFPFKLDPILGGLAGFVWGAFLALVLWVGLPSEYSPATGAIRYPALSAPPIIQDAVASSPFAPKLFAVVWQHPVARKVFFGPEPSR